MILKSLRLSYFKNHLNSEFKFGKRINCITGKNGKGKTNLLDAIYYLSFTKSALGIRDRLAISHQSKSFTLFGLYEGLTLALQYERGKTKSLKIDGNEQEKLSEVIGRVPAVLILPDDTAMIKEGSEERRRFFDGALSQFDKAYLATILKYNKLLKQRNSLLKQEEKKGFDHRLLDSYDEQIIPLSTSISKKRRELVDLFSPFFKTNYAQLHKKGETPSLNFISHVEDDFSERFASNRAKDRVMQRTLLGSHRDDIAFLLNGEPLRNVGSQGQRKTFIIALKLALYDFLKERIKEKPLLLIDDIFDKLDESRIQLLLSLLKNEARFGQIFITDARMEKSTRFFELEKETTFIELF